jgi:hypothetical protein
VKQRGQWRIVAGHYSEIKQPTQAQNLPVFEIRPAPESIRNLKWIELLEDKAGDGRQANSADGKALSYHYDAGTDMLWFRLELRNSVNAEAPAVSISLDIDADQNTGANWYGANTKFKYDKILNLGALTKQNGSQFIGYNGITTDKGAIARNWLDEKKGNLTFYLDAEQRAYFLGVKRADIAPGLRKFHLIGSVGANALWNDDIGDEGFATIELPVK